MLGRKSNDAFQIQPPMQVDYAPVIVDGEIRKSMSFDNVNAPQMMDEAWMKYIIEFHLPQDLEQLIVCYMKPLIDLAPKSNIRRREITMYLIQYDLIWDGYFIYMRKGKYDPKLLVVKEILRNAIELQLNRSVDGWLGRMMHTKLFRIFTSDDKSRVEKGARFFGKKNRNDNQGGQ